MHKASTHGIMLMPEARHNDSDLGSGECRLESEAGRKIPRGRQRRRNITRIASTELLYDVQEVKPDPIPDAILLQITEELHQDCMEISQSTQKIAGQQKGFFLPIWVETKVVIGTDVKV